MDVPVLGVLWVIWPIPIHNDRIIVLAAFILALVPLLIIPSILGIPALIPRYNSLVTRPPLVSSMGAGRIIIRHRSIPLTLLPSSLLLPRLSAGIRAGPILLRAMAMIAAATAALLLELVLFRHFKPGLLFRVLQVLAARGVVDDLAHELYGQLLHR